MLSNIIQLFYQFYDSNNPEDLARINRAKRLVEKAQNIKCDDIIVGACYLYEVLDKNYDLYYETLEIIKNVDKQVAKLVDKVTKKVYETWPEYYFRISLVPEASQIVWLIMLQELEKVDTADYIRIHSNMERIFKGHINLYK